MGVKEEVIELQRLDQRPKAIGEQVDLIAFPQHARNLSRLDARRDEVERPSRCCHRAKLCCDIMRCLLDTATSVEVVVEGQATRVHIHPEEDMQPG